MGENWQIFTSVAENQLIFVRVRRRNIRRYIVVVDILIRGHGRTMSSIYSINI